MQRSSSNLSPDKTSFQSLRQLYEHRSRIVSECPKRNDWVLYRFDTFGNEDFSEFGFFVKEIERFFFYSNHAFRHIEMNRFRVSRVFYKLFAVKTEMHAIKQRVGWSVCFFLRSFRLAFNAERFEVSYAVLSAGLLCGVQIFLGNDLRRDLFLVEIE